MGANAISRPRTERDCWRRRGGGRGTRSPRRSLGYLVAARNVATLADTPRGQQGRPSNSLTLDQAIAVTAAARTTEIVYRRELRPVITTGAEIMDQLFTAT